MNFVASVRYLLLHKGRKRAKFLSEVFQASKSGMWKSEKKVEYKVYFKGFFLWRAKFVSIC